MLLYLHVRNFALIHELEIEFDQGLSVLSGETGAGKSILIGSMNAISGNKLDTSIIRRGQDHALVEMQFELNNASIEKFNSNYGIAIGEDHTVILSRKYNRSGRSIYRANGMIVTATVMLEIFDVAIDIHSQHEHQSLLNPKAHMDLLDQYIGDQVIGVKFNLSTLFSKYRSYRKRLNEDHLNDEQRRREIDFLKFEIQEIDKAKLNIDEDKQLQLDYQRLFNKKKIDRVIEQVGYISRSSSETNISDQLAVVIQELTSVSDLDEGLKALLEEAMQLESIFFDFNRSVDSYKDGSDESQDGLEAVTERIHVINTLKQKYGDTIELIIESRELKQSELDDLMNYEANIIGIKAEIEQFESELLNLCKKLSELRRSAAIGIAKEIEGVLEQLNFNNNQVEVQVLSEGPMTANGYDVVNIMISTNKNEPVQPLNKIASGGELSRVMLALKSVFAEMDQLDTLVFDEIDTGISGRTAQKVAEKMVQLSKKRQIICITHLPQIAAMADRHYLINKTEVEDHVETSIDLLSDDGVYDELSRLIGGATITVATYEAAKEMKQQAAALKK